MSPLWLKVISDFPLPLRTLLELLSLGVIIGKWLALSAQLGCVGMVRELGLTTRRAFSSCWTLPTLMDSFRISGFFPHCCCFLWTLPYFLSSRALPSVLPTWHSTHTAAHWEKDAALCVSFPLLIWGTLVIRDQLWLILMFTSTIIIPVICWRHCYVPGPHLAPFIL